MHPLLARPSLTKRAILVVQALVVPVAARAQDPHAADLGGAPPVAAPTTIAASDVPAAQPRARPHPFLSVDGGYTLQSLYGVPMTSADIAVAVGRASGDFAFGAILEVMPGATEDGLSTIGGTVGALFEGRLGRVRLGGGARIGGFNVQRVTTGSGMFSLAIGAYSRVSYDVLAFDDARNHALFVIVKGSGDVVGGAILGASLGIGVRF